MATPVYNYMIGTNASGSGAMTNVESLATPVPAPRTQSFHPYSQMLALGDGTIRGGGWANVEWVFDNITDAQRDMLRTFCTGASQEVWIQTKTMDTLDTYAIYHAIMVWPIETESRDANGFRVDLKIRFQRLI
jgi:hypothetical protein